MLLNSLNERTFAAALKSCCVVNLFEGFFAKLNTAAPTQLGKKKKKKKHVHCTVWLISLSRDWLSRFKFFFKGLLFIGGRNASQARPQGLLVFRHHIGK